MKWLLLFIILYPLVGFSLALPTVLECVRDFWEEDNRSALYAGIWTLAVVSIKWPYFAIRSLCERD